MIEGGIFIAARKPKSRLTPAPKSKTKIVTEWECFATFCKTFMRYYSLNESRV